jgi:hypothetical protein
LGVWRVFYGFLEKRGEGGGLVWDWGELFVQFTGWEAEGVGVSLGRVQEESELLACRQGRHRHGIRRARFRALHFQRSRLRKLGQI